MTFSVSSIILIESTLVLLSLFSYKEMIHFLSFFRLEILRHKCCCTFKLVKYNTMWFNFSCFINYGITHNIYFWLRFGLANEINNHLRLKIRVVSVGNFELWMFIDWLYIKIFETNVKNRFLCKKNTCWICVLVLWIHKGYFVIRKLVLNVVLKLSGI